MRILSSGSESGSGSAASGVVSLPVDGWCGIEKAGLVTRGLWCG